jgi:hypothetical protein
MRISEITTLAPTLFQSTCVTQTTRLKPFSIYILRLIFDINHVPLDRLNSFVILYICSSTVGTPSPISIFLTNK